MTLNCIAPLNNMYFTIKGEASPCWLTVGAIDQWSRDRSISDIWFGEHFGAIRNRLANNIFTKKCLVCKKDADEGVWPLAKAYEDFPVKSYPTLMELELSNQCNLECLMCTGLLSSGIRKNRDKLPPIPMAYDGTFVEQLREFIPHLQELRFNGGEPFAQPIVYEICALVAELNPGLKINVATNGTVLNKRVRKVMADNNLHLNISIDSLNKGLYEQIRVNGDFDKLMENFDVFHQYCADNSRHLSVMVNPMANNWFEMAHFARWTHEKDVDLWYNTIRNPEYLSIWKKPSEWLGYVVQQMEIQRDNEKKPEFAVVNSPRNLDKFDNLLKQVKNWYLDSLLSEESEV